MNACLNFGKEQQPQPQETLLMTRNNVILQMQIYVRIL